MDDRPERARRVTAEREARGWNKPRFVAARRAPAHTGLPRSRPGDGTYVAAATELEMSLAGRGSASTRR
jgi:hypothetical protein